MVSDIRSSNSSKVQATCDMAASVTTCSRVVVWLGGGGGKGCRECAGGGLWLSGASHADLDRHSLCGAESGLGCFGLFEYTYQPQLQITPKPDSSFLSLFGCTERLGGVLQYSLVRATPGLCLGYAMLSLLKPEHTPLEHHPSSAHDQQVYRGCRLKLPARG